MQKWNLIINCERMQIHRQHKTINLFIFNINYITGIWNFEHNNSFILSTGQNELVFIKKTNTGKYLCYSWPACSHQSVILYYKAPKGARCLGVLSAVWNIKKYIENYCTVKMYLRFFFLFGDNKLQNIWKKW